MPVILSQDDIGAWLDVRDERADVMRLVRPCPDDWLDMVPVSSRVNKVENDDAGLLEPLSEPEAAPVPETQAQGEEAALQRRGRAGELVLGFSERRPGREAIRDREQDRGTVPPCGGGPGGMLALAFQFDAASPLRLSPTGGEGLGPRLKRSRTR